MCIYTEMILGLAGLPISLSCTCLAAVPGKLGCALLLLPDKVSLGDQSYLNLQKAIKVSTSLPLIIL